LLPQSDTEQATALSRRLRAAYASAIEPLRLDVRLALDYGLAVYPDDGEQQGILTRVADERLYQLKNGTQPSGPAASTGTQAAPAEKKELFPSTRPAGETAQVACVESSAAERRRWERVSLAGTRAYALIVNGIEITARVLDLGYGGVCLEATFPEGVKEAFHAVLHVPILPPVRVSLRRVYLGPGSAGASRIGCSFVT
jgi:hypothetical protein